MALYRCMGGGGGKLEETVLWENPSPSSNFGNTTTSPYNVTLSQTYSNFDYVKIVYRYSTSDSTEYAETISSTQLGKSSTYSTFTIGVNSGSGNTRIRTGYATSSTTIGFLGCYQTTTSSQSVSTAYIIPVKIIGLKQATGSRKIASGIATISTSGSTTVNLGFKPKYLSTITYLSDTKAVFCVYDSDISTSSVYRGAVNGSTTSAQRLTFPVAYSSSSAATINSITDTGFIMTQSTSTYGTNCYYFASE